MRSDVGMNISLLRIDQLLIDHEITKRVVTMNGRFRTLNANYLKSSIATILEGFYLQLWVLLVFQSFEAIGEC